MEGVGARLGRSSTRYGPTTVFNGPVRKWQKTWVHLPNPSSNNSSHPNNGNGGGGYPHLLLFKWTPMPSTALAGDGGATAGKDSGEVTAEAATEEPNRRKFRYVPVTVIGEQKLEDAAKTDDDIKPDDADASPLPTQSDGSDDKPDVNDIPKEETQASKKNQDAQQKANETNLDLSLGLKSHEGERKADQKWVDRSEGGIFVGRPDSRRDLEMKRSVNLEAENRRKRKAVAPDLEMSV